MTLDAMIEGEDYSWWKSGITNFACNMIPFLGETKTAKKIGKVTSKYGENVFKAVIKHGDGFAKGASNLVQVTAGKNFKDHFIRHKKLLEGLLGTKYPKYKKDGARFIDDIGRAINEGHVQFVGNATLRGGDEVYKVYRGNGITISTLQRW